MYTLNNCRIFYNDKQQGERVRILFIHIVYRENFANILPRIVNGKKEHQHERYHKIKHDSNSLIALNEFFPLEARSVAIYGQVSERNIFVFR
mgnify:CR=1 FL=1